MVCFAAIPSPYRHSGLIFYRHSGLIFYRHSGASRNLCASASKSAPSPKSPPSMPEFPQKSPKSVTPGDCIYDFPCYPEFVRQKPSAFTGLQVVTVFQQQKSQRLPTRDGTYPWIESQQAGHCPVPVLRHTSKGAKNNAQNPLTVGAETTWNQCKTKPEPASKFTA